MYQYGAIREIDSLDRVVIPKDIIRRFYWEPGMPVEVYPCHSDGIDYILIRKYTPTKIPHSALPKC